jgi:hypothetical protein
MANEVSSAWPIEQIPDSDFLYMRAHRQYFSDGQLMPGVFRDKGGGMSVEWSKYSTPADSRQRANRPSENAIIELLVADVTALPGLAVLHDPIPSNRAHTNVEGEKDAEIRLRLLQCCRVAIALQQ